LYFTLADSSTTRYYNQQATALEPLGYLTPCGNLRGSPLSGSGSSIAQLKPETSKRENILTQRNQRCGNCHEKNCRFPPVLLYHTFLTPTPILIPPTTPSLKPAITFLLPSRKCLNKGFTGTKLSQNERDVGVSRTVAVVD